MFNDNNKILDEINYQMISSSPNRIFNILQNYKKIFFHIIVHHIIQIIALLICIILISTNFSITEHPLGIKILISEMVFSVIALFIYICYLPLLFIAFKTHPLFIADPNGKPLFAKIANLVHRFYSLTLGINVILSLLLSFSFNPTGSLHKRSDGIYSTLVCFLIFLGLSCGEIQKPLLFITRKIKSVEISFNELEVEEPLKGSSFADKIGVFTLGYNFIGFQCYVKYHFDPNQPTIQPELYLSGWVKNF
ncbi:hypothetical protein EHI8A_075610 [Entamoeba histolytica HM-1:IMSS-B]|uniref:Uncharacterized protein n=6 Tax=Entamoeba histolytica TaxID=5759 RepID=C4LZJ3_ENTH1|nr:hypothetical protein EHI_124590 [Entamoeba histolytica HM-1:IMSS]EMD48708.1 Hypothetical protein EHI5A_065690 [Entamoeba histolytica KU27]EMH77463.1 hypothetical protein EHI8A_075610 [Entamoeba histolytica HM-1:IMSS-B]EMS17393.1 hypothetical protein KM1_075890 [Entamoeba histolytica HM-3:IMSS]ENY62446.1 hypothetical protein EHI7A_037080 [Entamoeba histolytica HM-1:IMSS-A]EAL49480.1 hypothetical protein EHI_124590 [Entamoeba histolytica HM-1:IMSS]|eukprot:XP_654867.1 hypothetical protein EHI_124590 [Entamoeba histolytica HM-1:IMSS]